MSLTRIARTLFSGMVAEQTLHVQLMDPEGRPLVLAGPPDDQEVFDLAGGEVSVRSLRPGREFLSLPLEGRPGGPSYLVASFPAVDRMRWQGLLAAIQGVLSYCGEKEYETENLSEHLGLAFQEICTFEDLSRELPGYASVEQMAETALSALCKATGASQALFALCDDSGTTYRVLLQLRNPRGRVDVSYPVSQGIIGRTIREQTSRAIDAEEFAAAGLTEIESQATRNMLVVPMPFTSTEKSQALGALCLIDKGKKDTAGVSTSAAFTSTEQRLAEAIGILVGALLGTRQTAELRKEMELAETIQNSLLPKNAPEVTGFDLAGEYRPARQVGGDYFDFVPMADGSILAAIADVSGHNLASGMMMFMARALIRAAAARGGSPGRILGELSANLAQDLMENERFITLFLVRVRAGSRVLKYASAGHNPPLLVRKDGTCERLEDEGMMIGFSAGQTYRESRASIRRGDVLVLYTDGITEAQAADGDMFGEDRLVATIASVRTEPARKILERIFTAVAGFADGTGEGDDATAIVLKAV